MNITPMRQSIRIITNKWNIFVDEFGTYIRLIDGRLIRKLTQRGFRHRDRTWATLDCIDLVEQAELELGCKS